MLVGEVEDLRKMMESLKRMVTGQGLEEKRGETGDQEASLEEAEEKEKEKSVGEKTRENSSTDNKDGTRIRPGAQMIATHDYKKNPESPVGNELDVNEGDTLAYLMTNENNEHWWLADDGKGQVGYVPATYLKIIRDVTRQEEESDTAGKEGYGKKTDGSKIGGDMGQDGERRKTYSAAVIEGFKRNSAIYAGDSIVRKTDSRLNKGEDVVVCLPGARIEHVTARVFEPTRAARVLDIVLSSQKEFVDNVEIQEPLGSSDHNQLHFNINIKSDKTKVKQCRRDFRKGNYREIRKNLAHIDWDEKMKNKTATECWDILRGELDTAIDSYVPMKKQGKRSKKKHLSKEAFRKMRYKQNMWRVYKHTGKDKDYKLYKEALNAATNEVRKAKRNSEHKLAQHIKSDSKSFYAYVRSKQNVRDKVGPLEDNAEI